MTICDLLYAYENYEHLVRLYDSIDETPLTNYIRMPDIPSKFYKCKIASFVANTSDRTDVIVLKIHVDVPSHFEEVEEEFKHAKTCNSVL